MLSPQSTVKCAGRAHHHLFKPCAAATVVTALNQALALEASLSSDIVRSVIGQMRWLPSPPAVYSRIMAEIQSHDASVETIGDLIAEDPAITAKVLQLANSAVFGLRLQVTQPADAVANVFQHERGPKRSPATPSEMDLPFLRNAGLERRLEVWRSRCFNSNSSSRRRSE